MSKPSSPTALLRIVSNLTMSTASRTASKIPGVAAFDILAVIALVLAASGRSSASTPS
jgi:hypothetical protein